MIEVSMLQCIEIFTVALGERVARVSDDLYHFEWKTWPICRSSLPRAFLTMWKRLCTALDPTTDWRATKVYINTVKKIPYSYLFYITQMNFLNWSSLAIFPLTDVYLRWYVLSSKLAALIFNCHYNYKHKHTECGHMKTLDYSSPLYF